MDYIEAIEFIKNTMKFGSKLGLDNMNKLLNLLDSPQDKLNIIHVAGTNGKGSTCAFIQSILKESGFRVGLYTSPSIDGFTGRIKINDSNIRGDRFADVANKVKDKIKIMLSEGMDHPTEFEIITAMALLYYYEENVDFVVLEVGLGGRLDATNIVKNPLLSVITPIGYDHMDYLGDTLGKIAFEKAGIVKENNFVVTANQENEALEVINEVAKEKDSKVYTVDLSSLDIHISELNDQLFSIKIFDQKYCNMNIKLNGVHQIENACLALTAIEVLKDQRNIRIDKESIYKGLLNTKWPGRFEVISENPYTIIDGAHNVHAAIRLKETIEKVIPGKSIILVIGMLGDKDVDGVLDLLIPLSKEIVIAEPSNSRALSIIELESKIKRISLNTHTSSNVEEALNIAHSLAKKGDVILVAGSLYLIENVRRILVNKNSD
ncbi:bifunctional folylpolyglutamate synthase/dihydrofolate synthase [Serpentinicella alkaliphila]|uniref:tetrahydrofolate synthase n=1 Tax=Serpentinicella alkaliphila TaxID=1734049 RepID=A0A4R2U8M7_9FIRM|nr:folylpolyglutamate synthase/dihydrofolate synthase family protein [Serpentinicella alkaliphila]QUH24471.1 bifunctional folylpolyglutamate synthase/dihydrofolate synthase [Serpentinicella alkaliphila]TCQ04133.1 dihydrofolate synthase/folylpolyglutamate synthase [Serpentinicella alkaliphila]